MKILCSLLAAGWHIASFLGPKKGLWRDILEVVGLGWSLAGLVTGILYFSQPAEAGILHRIVKIAKAPIEYVVDLTVDIEECISAGLTYGWD